MSNQEYNRLSVAQELQADYFDGLFAYYVYEKEYLDKDDIEEFISTVSIIGDDRIYETSWKDINMDSFTHNSSKQRQ